MLLALLFGLSQSVVTVHAQEEGHELSLPFEVGASVCAGEPFKAKRDGAYQCKLDYGAHTVTAKFAVKNQKFEGPVLGFSDQGVPIYQGAYKNGLLDGEVKSEYSKEKKRFNKTEHYRNGKLDGTSIVMNNYNDNVNVEFYKEDKREGFAYAVKAGKIESASDCRRHGENAPDEKCNSIVIPGFERQWSVYKGGKAQEQAAKVASENGHVELKNKAGVVIERYDQKNSQIFGKHEIFFDNGKPQLVTNEVGSVKRDLVEYFDDGHMKRKVVYEPNRGTAQVEIEHDEWFQNGKPKIAMTRKFSADRSWSGPYKTYYDNGAIQEEGMYAGLSGDSWPGYRTHSGPIKFFDEKGHLLEIRTYKAGKLDGVTKSISVDEQKRQVIIEDMYKDDVLQARTISDAKSKKKLEEILYMPDGSTKSDKKY